MSKGIDLSIAADTRSAMTAIQRGLIDPLDDVADALELLGDSRDISDLENDARAAESDIQRGLIDPLEDVADALDDIGQKRDIDDLESSMRDAQRRTEDAKDEIRDLRDELNKAGRAGKDAGKDIEKGLGDGTRDGAKKAKVSLDDVKDEARQSGTEAAASFSGEFTDGLDFAQEVAANLGPAGIAGGLLIGAVGAVATQAVEEWNEKIQGIKDATAEMWQEAASEGQAFIDGEAVRAETHRIIWDKAYEEQFRAAEEAGVSRAELATALATGEGEVYDRVHRQIMDARAEEQQAAIDSMNASTDGNVALQDAVAVTNTELARTVTVLEEKGRATDENKRKAEDASAADKLQQEKLREQIDRTMDAARERYEGLAKQYGHPIKAKVEFEVDDYKVRTYRPPTIRGTVRLSPQLDQAV